jgi:hypothetical protein
MNRTRAARSAASIALAAIAAGLGATQAHAAVTLSGASPLTSCAAQTMTQRFAAFGDRNAYTLAPEGDFSSATDWQLSGGAAVVQTTDADGQTGDVLDLPSKAQATSPVMCITSDYPTARLDVRNLKGSEGVFFYVSYYQNGTWTTPKNTGQFHGGHSDWTLSNPMNVQPLKTSGWQQVRFTFVAGGTTSHFQADDFWVDPRAHW